MLAEDYKITLSLPPRTPFPHPGIDIVVGQGSLSLAVKERAVRFAKTAVFDSKYVWSQPHFLVERPEWVEQHPALEERFVRPKLSHEFRQDLVDAMQYGLLYRTGAVRRHLRLGA